MNRINELLRLSLIICALFGTTLAEARGLGPAGRGEASAAGLAARLERLRAALDERWVDAYGTWSGARATAAAAAPMRELRLRALAPEGAPAAARLAKAAGSYLQLLDPVWGGAFQRVELTSVPTVRRARVSDGRKLAASQAQALEVLALAWMLSGEVRFRNGLEKVDAYLQDWLAAPGGGYFEGQRGAPAGLPAQVDAARYWALRTEHERRRFGLPPSLRDVRTRDTALLAAAYVAAYEATGEPNHLRVAERLGRLLASAIPASADAEEALPVALALLRLHEVSLAGDWWSPALRAAAPALAGAASGNVTRAAQKLRLRWRLARHREASLPGPAGAAQEPLLAALGASEAELSTVALAEAAEALALLGSEVMEARLVGSAEHVAYAPLLAAAATGLRDPRAVIVRISSSAAPHLVLCRDGICSAPLASPEGFAAAAAAFRQETP